MTWYRYLVYHGIDEALEQSPLVSINLTSRQLANDIVYAMIQRINQPSRVILEWVEMSAPPEMDASAVKRLLILREQYGFQLAVDDAGAGVDALRRIRAISPEWVKLDGEIFQAGAAYEGGLADLACRAIVHVAHGTGAKTVAEWVETPAQLRYAEHIGSDLAQGRLFSA